MPRTVLALAILPSLALAASAVSQTAFAQTQATPPGTPPLPPAGTEAAPDQGVIRPPPHVDPEINRAPPGGGIRGGDPMPVVPPPGSPGGDPHVIPK